MGFAQSHDIVRQGLDHWGFPWARLPCAGETGQLWFAGETGRHLLSAACARKSRGQSVSCSVSPSEWAAAITGCHHGACYVLPGAPLKALL